MYAIDAATGEARWTFDTAGTGFRSAPVIWGDTVLISTDSGVLYAFNKASGEVSWQTGTGRGDKYRFAAIDDGLVFLPYEGYLYAIDVEDGSQIWKIEARIEYDTRMAAAEGVLYFRDERGLRAVDIATGNDLWQWGIGRLKSSPAVADGVVYVGTFPFLYALDAATGQTLWNFDAGGFIEGTPLVEGGVAYFGSTDDYIYAVSIASEAPDEPPPPQPGSLLPPLIHLISPKVSGTASRIMWGLGPVSVAVSADGGTLVVGDPVVSAGGTYGGAAVVFTKQGDTWDATDADHAVALLPPEQPGWEGLEPRDYWDGSESFGQDVAVSADGRIVVVGAPEHRPPGQAEGAVYVFIRPEGGWSEGPEVVTLLSPQEEQSWGLGDSVAVSADGRTVVAGLESKPSDGSLANVFTMPDSGWSDAANVARLLTTTEIYTSGSTLSMSSDGATVALGPPEVGIRGVVFIFQRPGGQWSDKSEEAILRASDGSLFDRFGHAVSVDSTGDTVLVGAPGKDAYAEDHGAVYVFAKPESGWANAVESAVLTAADGGREHDFGNSVAISAAGDHAIVVAPLYRGIPGRPGGVYLFSIEGSDWRSRSLPAMNSDLREDEELTLFGLGWSLALGPETAVIGGLRGDAFLLVPPSNRDLFEWLEEVGAP